MDIEGDGMFPWHVHKFPFPHNAQENPCRAEITGGHYDPLAKASRENYTEACASDSRECEVGDLSGRLGRLDMLGMMDFTDVVPLYGVYSIIGRSVVIHRSDGARLVCANIGYPSGDPMQLLYAPFRGDFTGSIYLRQHTDVSTASVFSDLVSTGDDAGMSSTGHNWHVHESPLDMDGADCNVAGPHYNPRGVDITSPQYSTLCSPTNQTNCEVGDLAGKGGAYDISDGVIRHLYTDTDLQLVGDDQEDLINGRSIVIHMADGGAPRIACANITTYVPLEVVAVFTGEEENSIVGMVAFSQASPFDPTRVVVSLRGLGGMAGGYHVHVSPVGPDEVGSPARCNSTYAGGHWNPLGVANSGGLSTTSDGYEIGDLSGKFGSLSGKEEINASFYDPNIPLFGPLGIVGRSVVIHRDDEAGTRWVCADIVHTRPVVTVTFSIESSSFRGEVTLVQPADDPLADTIITIDLEVLIDLEAPTPETTSSASSVSLTPSPDVSSSPTSAVDVSSSFPSDSESSVIPTPSSTEDQGVLSVLLWYFIVDFIDVLLQL